ncbi:hypothetical protein KW496_19490 [Vibrio fluvialis]|nr:hypothetical protein [Vibrio fluvialis]
MQIRTFATLYNKTLKLVNDVESIEFYHTLLNQTFDDIELTDESERLEYLKKWNWNYQQFFISDDYHQGFKTLKQFYFDVYSTITEQYQ